MMGAVFPGGVYYVPATRKSVWLTVANRTVELPRMKMGDSKTLEMKPAESFDLFFVQSTWPELKQLKCTFGAVPKIGTTIFNNFYPEFRRLMQAYPGWVSEIRFPSYVGPGGVIVAGATIYGVISNIAYSEVDNCGMTISFDLDIVYEWFPGRMATT